MPHVVGCFQAVGNVHYAVGNNGVKRGVDVGKRGGTTHHTKFEFVARKGKRRGAVAVGCMRKIGQRVLAEGKLCTDFVH